MKSKHPQQPASNDTSKANALSNTASKLADIELKIDHLIEQIHDSLYRMKTKDKGQEDSL